MSGHTPGPWVVMKGNRSPRICVKGDAGWPIVVLSSGHNDRAIKANERLIAAAPELFAALAALTELGEHVPVFQLDGGKSSVKAVRLAAKFNGAMNAARAAIDKAQS